MARSALLAVGRRVLILFTPTRPPWKGGVSRVLARGTKKRRQPFDCLLLYPLRGSNDEVVARIPIKQSADRRSSNKSPSYPRNPYYVSSREGTIWWRSAEGRCSIGGDAGSLLTKHLPPILCRSVQLRHQTKKTRTFRFSFRTPSGARTLDPNIKSVVLYQLS